MNDLIPYADMERMATAMAKSGMFGKTTEQMLSLMLVAQAEGLHPAIAAMEYDVIKGKPAINSKAALSRFQASGGKIQWKTRTDKEASAHFSHPSGGELDITWTWDRATKAGLTTKTNKDGSENMWQKFPDQMLAARVIAEGVRAVNPACLSRMYTVEEVQDFDPPKKQRDVTPSSPVVEPKEPPTDPKPDAPKPPADPPATPDNGHGDAEQIKKTVEDITAVIKEHAQYFSDGARDYYRKAIRDAKGLPAFQHLLEEAKKDAENAKRIAEKPATAKPAEEGLY